MAFATEPVFASLANVLGDHSNMPEEEGGDGSIKKYKLQDIEIKYGLLQVGDFNSFNFIELVLGKKFTEFYFS